MLLLRPAQPSVKIPANCEPPHRLAGSTGIFKKSRKFLLTNPLFLNLHIIGGAFLKIRTYHCVQPIFCGQIAAYFVAFQNVLVDTIALTDPGHALPGQSCGRSGSRCPFGTFPHSRTKLTWPRFFTAAQIPSLDSVFYLLFWRRRWDLPAS